MKISGAVSESADMDTQYVKSHKTSHCILLEHTYRMQCNQREKRQTTENKKLSCH